MREVLRAIGRDLRYGGAEGAQIGYVPETNHGRTTHRLDVVVDGELEKHANVRMNGPLVKKRFQKALNRMERYARLRAKKVTLFEKTKTDLTTLGLISPTSELVKK